VRNIRKRKTGHKIINNIKEIDLHKIYERKKSLNISGKYNNLDVAIEIRALVL
jgi:hypothetical protein